MLWLAGLMSGPWGWLIKWGVVAVAIFAGYKWITGGARTEERHRLQAEWYEQQAVDTRASMEQLQAAYQRDREAREKWERHQQEIERQQRELGERILQRHRDDFRKLNEVLANEPNGACATWGARPIDCPISWSVRPLPSVPSAQSYRGAGPGFVCANPACVSDPGAGGAPDREAYGESGASSAVDDAEGAR